MSANERNKINAAQKPRKLVILYITAGTRPVHHSARPPATSRAATLSIPSAIKMVYNFKVFKKCAPNGKITLYMAKRDFIDHISFVEPIGSSAHVISQVSTIVRASNWLRFSYYYWK